MSKHEECLHCSREIFFSTLMGKWLHWYTSQPECGTSAEPKR